MANPSQNRNSNRRSRSHTNGGGMIPISSLNSGITTFLPRSALKGNWKKAHGITAAGVQVNSLDYQHVEGSTIVNDKGAITPFSRDEFQVLARKVLEEDGFKVSAPDGSNIDGGH